MSKAIAIVALVIVCIGIGAIAGGLGVYYSQPLLESKTVATKAASCVLISSSGVDGRIEFTQAIGKKIVVSGNVTALTTGRHGFHIHQFGVVDDDCKSAGGHYNPRNTSHGAPTDPVHHIGDMGNIDNPSGSGVFSFELRDLDVSLFGPESIIGRGLVIHANPDDFVSQPTGNAGGRAACCTVMHVNPTFK